jgi:hypothetical protein
VELGLLIGAATAAFGGMWLIHRWRLRHLAAQRDDLRQLSAAADEFRTTANVPEAVAVLVERMLRMPLDPRAVRRFFWHVVRTRSAGGDDPETERLGRAIRSMDRAAVDAFARVIVTHMRMFAHSSPVFGALLRVLLLGGLSRNTQAEVTVETFARQSGHVMQAG